MEPLKLGTMLSQKYRIDRLAHEGPGVHVYEATDTVGNRAVRVKIIGREALAHPDAFARFQSGAHDPGVIDFGNVAGLPFYVTELSLVLLDDDDDDDAVTLELQTRAAIACTTRAAT